MNRLLGIWAAALATAGFGSWILFEAVPGLNWGLWTLLAAAGLALSARLGGRTIAGPLFCTLSLACTLAGGAAVTADPEAHVWLALAVAALLAVAMLLAADPANAQRGLGFLIAAPLVAATRGLVEAGRRAGELAGLLATERWRPAVRGSLVALPIVAVFGSMLANADPILAAARDGLVEILERLEFIPRLIFFTTLLTAAVGAYGASLRARSAPAGAPPLRAPLLHAGATERLIVLGAVASLFAAFFLLQLAYLFGNPGAAAGSGITFAEYARRGFAELTIVATLGALLILALDRCGERGRLDGVVRLVEWVLILETELLLVSAFRRVALYEAAYGFTTARVYAQAYMVVMALVLAMLAAEVRGAVDTRRLGRRALTAGALALLALTYWNHEGWIATQNIERAARAGRLDSGYIFWGLSANAVPAVVAALDRVPPDLAAGLREGLAKRYGAQVTVEPCRWFEWNLRHAEAARALQGAGISMGRVRARAAGSPCLRLERGHGRD